MIVLVPGLIEYLLGMCLVVFTRLALYVEILLADWL